MHIKGLCTFTSLRYPNQGTCVILGRWKWSCAKTILMSTTYGQGLLLQEVMYPAVESMVSAKRCWELRTLHSVGNAFSMEKRGKTLHVSRGGLRWRSPARWLTWTSQDLQQKKSIRYNEQVFPCLCNVETVAKPTTFSAVQRIHVSYRDWYHFADSSLLDLYWSICWHISRVPLLVE